MKVSSGTIARTVCLILALLNQVLVIFKKDALPFSDDSVYSAVSMIFTAAAAIAAWWKNNSFTRPALIGDAVMSEEKARAISGGK